MSKKLPTLAEYRKKVPKGGLLNKGLRKGAGLGIKRGKKAAGGLNVKGLKRKLYGGTRRRK